VKDRYFCRVRRRKEPHTALGVSTRLHSGGTVSEIEKLQGEIDDTLKEMAALNRMTFA
jgi:hypothetical protein